jgi:predicted ATPase/DNA-binding XRE family transcriptional regulator
MKSGAPVTFGAQLKALREAAGFTQEELAAIAGLSVQAIGALERGRRRRPHVETVRALSAALDLTGATRDALLKSARASTRHAVNELGRVSLPLPLTAFLGRDTDLQTLRRWLEEPAARLVTLIGPGGVGKTRLALELARSIAEEGMARVVFVGLADVRDPEFVAPAIAEALGLSDVTAVDLPARVGVACDEPTLLVLDNCEHVLDAMPLVAELLASAASLRVLATSRAALRMRGEREYGVGPLALEVDAETMSPASLPRSPAVRLFLERIRDVQPDFRLTSTNSRAVAAICRRLDALPLALELAAPWIKVLTLDGMLRRLSSDALLPTVGPRDLPVRQQTISATVAWSYRLLGADEQRAFRRLGALPGRFSIEAAAAVLSGREAPAPGGDAALRVAASLIDRSLLLRAEPSPPTRPLFQMLETVRAFANAELSAAGERDDALEGLTRYCIREASLAPEGLTGPSQPAWLDRVRDDLENYRCTLAWLIERRRPAEACTIAWGLMFFWLIRGRAAEGLRWYDQTLTLQPLPPAAEARALLGSAVMWYAQGEFDRVRVALTRASALARESGDTDVAVQAGNLFGHLEHRSGNIEAARDRFTTSVEGFRTLAIPWGVGNALIGLAGLALATGDTGRAETLLDEATLVLRDAGPWFHNLPLYVRAILAVRLGNLEHAIALVRESLARSLEVRDQFGFVYALVPLAAAAALKEDAAWAARILGARDAVAERTGATVTDTSIKQLREMAERESQTRLGPDRWARAYSAGRGASIDSLLKDIDNRCRTAGHSRGGRL